ncbi:MFS transporter [Pseudonocardia humida]|uniref:MFS transporter n=1 Tax=Pseudonocardia humida TaxID=2800819 RepID=A0ABT0ZTV8_9PSEU|nr:MFS transporter [Pseudonocardia humida]MCO1654144.1 MFS transporter [Pseudonocardia humida]
MTQPMLDTTARVRGLGTVMAGFFGVQLFVNIANGGVANSLVPNLIAELDEANKVAIFGLTGAVSAVAAVVSQPLWGLLSDRTRSRLGRRVPWIVGGVVGLGATLLGLALGGTVALVVALAAVVAIFYSMITGPLSAIIPDRTPVARRGVFSALGSLGIFVGGLIGIVIASRFVGDLTVGFVVMAGLAVIGGIPFALALRDRKFDTVAPVAERVSWTETLRSFFVDPRKHPDFFWAFIARLVLIVGYWSIVSFQLYILDDYIGLGLAQANEVFPLVTGVMSLAIIVALVPSGLISDRIGRRKPFVVVASIVVAVSCVVPIVSPTITGALVSIALGGLGIGVYLAVDQALMTQVLPNASDAGKDLGVLNIAQAGGQVLAPLVASLVISVAGYPMLYGFAAVMAVLAALAILPIRSVR